jgi:GT2 family glycosyltransferase/glycosyltransferase involved in cell wall biosynthesis
MRVLEIVHGFPPAAQAGTELYARSHARALAAAGDDVLVLTREHDPALPEYASRVGETGGLRVVWINNTFRAVRRFEETYANPAIDAAAARVIDDFQPEVAHIHHLTCLSTGIVRELSARGVPRLFTLHDYWLICHRGQLLDQQYRICDGPENDRCRGCLGVAGGMSGTGFLGARAVRTVALRLPWLPDPVRTAARVIGSQLCQNGREDEQLQRRLAHMRAVCDEIGRFLAPSAAMRDRFVQFGVDARRITLAPNGVDHRPFQGPAVSCRRSASAGPLRLGFVGSLMVSKAPHLLLEAARRMPSGSVSVDLFGSYLPYHGDDRYRERLAPLLDDPQVRLHGSVPHEDVVRALRSIDVLVVPSIWPENSPLVIQEAFLAGIPVVASRIGGIPEMVVDSRNGLLFDPGDVDALTDALRRLVERPGLVETLRKGVPAVRSIEDDVAAARAVYRESLGIEAVRHPVAAVGESRRGERVAAIVLNFRTPDETLLAVKALLASRQPLDEIVVVDNDAGGDLQRLFAGARQVITRSTGANLGFSGGMNAGIREALDRGADYVLLVNSDVIVPPDTVAQLRHALEADRRAGIAGPTVLSRSMPDAVASLGMKYAPATGRMRHIGHGHADEPSSPHQDGLVDGVSGCAMMIRREVFEAVGMLDEHYFFSFEDLDFCLRARTAGFDTVLVRRAAVYHEGGRSLGPRSPLRFYYATRNHLLLACRTASTSSRFATAFRFGSVLALNVAHAVVSPGGSVASRLAAVGRGARDYVAGRFGPVV